ncbi:MAG: RNA recognition motif domain-containing protein [Planctomycetota bacterium]
MKTRLYVGNLSYTTTADQLREMFEADGRQVVDVNVVSDRDTGRSRGFGFVEMGSSQDAEAAIKALDGQDCDGRSLRVNEARERTEGGGGGRGGYGGGGGGRRRY